MWAAFKASALCPGAGRYTERIAAWLRVEMKGTVSGTSATVSWRGGCGGFRCGPAVGIVGSAICWRGGGGLAAAPPFADAAAAPGSACGSAAGIDGAAVS